MLRVQTFETLPGWAWRTAVRGGIARAVASPARPGPNACPQKCRQGWLETTEAAPVVTRQKTAVILIVLRPVSTAVAAGVFFNPAGEQVEPVRTTPIGSSMNCIDLLLHLPKASLPTACSISLRPATMSEITLGVLCRWSVPGPGGRASVFRRSPS